MQVYEDWFGRPFQVHGHLGYAYDEERVRSLLARFDEVAANVQSDGEALAYWFVSGDVCGQMIEHSTRAMLGWAAFKSVPVHCSLTLPPNAVVAVTVTEVHEAAGRLGLA